VNDFLGCPRGACTEAVQAMDYCAPANSPNSNNVEHFAGIAAWARCCQGRTYDRSIISSYWFLSRISAGFVAGMTVALTIGEPCALP
jgi:hypothetical protein